MATLFISLVLIMGLTAVVAYTVFSFQRTSELTALAQRNVARLDGIASLMKANIRYDQATGKVMVPMGDASEGRTRLPLWVVGDDRTPWGARYAWCPYAQQALSETAPAGSSDATVAAGNGSTYAVRTVQTAQIGGPARPYVAQSDAPDASAAGQDIVGFIVSPTPYRSEAPDCADVRYRDGYFLIAGASPGSAPRVPGAAVPVTARGSWSASPMSALVEPTIYVAPSAAGSGAGTDPANPMAFSDALSLWRSVQPRSMTFSMASGSYTVSAGEADFRASVPGRAVRIVGNGASLTGSSAAVDIIFGADASLEGLSLSPDLGIRALPFSRVTLSGVSAGYVRVDGGDVTIENGSSVATSSRSQSVMDMTAGTLRLSGASQLSVGTGTSAAAAVAATGGEVVVAGADVAYRGAAGSTPFSLSGTARLNLSQKTDATWPRYSLNGGAWQPIDAAERRVVSATCGTGTNGNPVTCVAACPTGWHAESGGCGVVSADGASNYSVWESRPDGASTAADGTVSYANWLCRWRSDFNIAVTPAPRTAFASCARNRGEPWD